MSRRLIRKYFRHALTRRIPGNNVIIATRLTNAEITMNNEIDLKYYDIADEYSTESAKPVSDDERDAVARYFQLLVTRLMNNEEISEEAQGEMAVEAGIAEQRIDEIAEFLNQWGNE